MEDIGYGCCASVATLKELLSQFPRLKEQDVALILGVMAKSHAGDTSVVSSSTSDDNPFPLYISFSPAMPDEGKETRDPKSWDVSVFVDVVKELVCALL